MTIVASYIEAPGSRTPAVGVAVSARILALPSPWLADGTGKVLGTSTTWTGQDGWWRLDLRAHTAFEVGDYVYAEIVEHSTDPARAVTHYARIPPPDPTNPTKPVLLRDILVPPPNGQDQIPWTPVDRLARLRDVDADSVRAAKPGDYLKFGNHGKWVADHGPMIAITWEPDPHHQLGVIATVAGFGARGATLKWGDGTQTLVTTLDPVTHTYELAGVYTLTAIDVERPAFQDTATVTVKAAATRAHAFLDADDDWRVLLWIDEPEDTTTYRVDWGDGSPIEEIRGQRVPPHPRVPHQYVQVGEYTITVTDTATKRRAQRPVELGEIGVTYTFPNSPARVRMEALWFKPGATWQLYDLTSNQVVAQGPVFPTARVRGENQHDSQPGLWPLELREVVDGKIRRRTTRNLPIPTIWDWRLDVLSTWRPTPGQPGHQDVTVNARKARADCVVSWGDGAPDDTAAPNVAITHTYDLTQLPAAGWTLTIREIGLTDPRTWTRLIAKPRHVGQPVLSARDRGSVDLDVAGVDGPSNSDWYRISWGDGTSPDEVAAVGRWYPAHHDYTTAGSYSIAVDGPGVLDPIIRDVTVAIYPSPTITAAEARKDGATQAIEDPTRRTARINVNNSASGGPCLVDLGDGSPIRECAEIDSFTHRYPPPAVPLPPGWEMYWVIVTAKADRTARAQATVQMPFGAPRTLFFELTKVDRDTARLAITDQDHTKTVRVNWGDGTSEEVTVSPIDHNYLDAGTYNLTIAYTDLTESYPAQFTVDPPAETGGPR